MNDGGGDNALRNYNGILGIHEFVIYKCVPSPNKKNSTIKGKITKSSTCAKLPTDTILSVNQNLTEHSKILTIQVLFFKSKNAPSLL